MPPPPDIPGYDILQKIGEGGMATVWQARQEKLDRIVAIKILRSRLGAGHDDYERFLFEARAAASLIHPHIVQVIDAGEQDGHAYYVMEYVPGPTVGDRLVRNEAYPEDEALRIAEEVVEALDYGWRDHRVVHCDIKPDNILLHRNGRTKVADLGLARVLGQEVVPIEEGMTIGTPNYFSPEQALVEDDLDLRSDMYSLGATLYHMLTGALPFGDLDPERVAEEQVHGTLPDLIEVNSRVSTGACYLVEKLMAKHAQDRHADWREVLDDIRAVRRGQMIAAPLAANIPSTVGRSSARPPLRAAARPLRRGPVPATGPVRAARPVNAPLRGGYQSPPRIQSMSSVWPVTLVLALIVLALYAYTFLKGR